MINPVFATTTVVGLALPMLPTKSPRAERRLYWSGTLMATVSAFLALFPPNWQGGLAFAGVLAGGLTFRAYMTTPYIRIRGRTYAFNLSDSDSDDGSRGTAPPSDYDPAPDSYGGIATATKSWWLLVVIVSAGALMVTLFAVSGEGPWYAGGAATAVASWPSASATRMAPGSARSRVGSWCSSGSQASPRSGLFASCTTAPTRRAGAGRCGPPDPPITKRTRTCGRSSRTDR